VSFEWTYIFVAVIIIVNLILISLFFIRRAPSPPVVTEPSKAAVPSAEKPVETEAGKYRKMIRKKKLDKAINELKARLKETPDNTELREVLRDAYVQKGLFAEAAAEHKLVESKKPVANLESVIAQAIPDRLATFRQWQQSQQAVSPTEEISTRLTTFAGTGAPPPKAEAAAPEAPTEAPVPIEEIKEEMPEAVVEMPLPEAVAEQPPEVPAVEAPEAAAPEVPTEVPAPEEAMEEKPAPEEAMEEKPAPEEMMEEMPAPEALPIEETEIPAPEVPPAAAEAAVPPPEEKAPEAMEVEAPPEPTLAVPEASAYILEEITEEEVAAAAPTELPEEVPLAPPPEAAEAAVPETIKEEAPTGVEAEEETAFETIAAGMETREAPEVFVTAEEETEVKAPEELEIEPPEVKAEEVEVEAEEAVEEAPEAVIEAEELAASLELFRPGGGLLGSLVVSSSGRTLASNLQPGLDTSALVNICSSLAEKASAASKAIYSAELSKITVESEKGKILMIGYPGGVLAVVTSDEIDLGLIRHRMLHAVERAQRSLKE